MMDNLLIADLPQPYGQVTVNSDYKVSGPTGVPLQVLQTKLDWLTRPGQGPASGDGLIEFQGWLVQVFSAKLTLEYDPPDEVF